MRGFGRFLAVAAALLVAACADDPNATAPNPAGTAQNDPYESTNRKVFEFDNKFDQALLLPTAKAYVAVVPEPARDGIHNFLLNLDIPITFANDILQGDLTNAGQSFTRFAMNSTFGIGGLFDVASGAGIPPHEEDFGITLGKWGVGEGPYLVLPFLGPDPPRDATGQVVDIFLDPTTYIHLRDHFWYSAARNGMEILDLRSRNIGTLEGLERESIDYYASVRSLYRQRRNNAINNGRPDVTNLPDL
ncbi:MAG TPA: VacJ family lipoprotein [Rhizomicrobium sp.]|jgi:phospholipid-binding lipoprotein MlaA|nr:VacJ family lipoprotein [Rhizomicrobium sp.]